MDSKGNERAASSNLNGLRSALLTAAKTRWGIGVTIGYLAVFVVPVAVLLNNERWLGFAIATAAVVSIVGALLRWWSDSIRGSAEQIQRANELWTGIGQPIDCAMIADMRSQYSQFVERAKNIEQYQDDYFEVYGDPSPHLLVVQLRESAWWTYQLATTARKMVNIGSCAALAVSLSVIFADSTLVRIYGLAISSIILIDVFYLGFRFGKLATASNASFRNLDALMRSTDVTDRQAVISAANYQFARGGGPLIPDWLWRIHRAKLQKAWKPLSTVQH